MDKIEHLEYLSKLEFTVNHFFLFCFSHKLDDWSSKFVVFSNFNPVDFPMYELNEESGEIDFCHNPFSMPQGGLEALETKELSSKRSIIILSTPGAMPA